MLENRGQNAAMHKLILSPGDNSIDLKDYTRDCMDQLEKRLGHKLDWYGVTHENTDHNHPKGRLRLTDGLLLVCLYVREYQRVPPNIVSDP